LPLSLTSENTDIFAPRTRTPLFLLALLLVAANLRGSLTGVGPLLPAIQQDLSLSSFGAGVLGSLPLLMFALFAPLARLGLRFGAERLVLAGLVTLAFGILLRSEGHVAALYAGTVLLAGAIAMTNVLVPTLVKQHYPERVPALTSAYATVMQVFASLGSGIAVPLALWLPGGWRASLASWAALAVFTVLVWLPQLRGSRVVPVALAPAGAVQPPWRRALAWQVTGFMGAQSTLFYVAISWYPVYLHEYGFAAVTSGWLLTLYQVVALLAGMAVPLLIRRLPDQRLLAAGVAALGFTATAGMWLLPQMAAGWFVMLGLGAGPSLILSLSFIGLRAGSAQTVAALSLMTQGVGYFISMLGPVAFGLLHDASGAWSLPLAFVMLVAVAQGLCGLGAGRRLALP
jgi:MFS transporter, CP family, cyanate transporter